MASVLDLNINAQNVCCDKVLNYLRQSKDGVPLTYRYMVKTRLWDNYCQLTDTSPSEAFEKLDNTINVPLKILDELNYKYKCTDLCPFPCCLDDLHCWEWDLIKNWVMIENCLSWLSIGMRMDKIAQWHNVKIDDIRKWNTKRKRLDTRAEIYRGFQDYLDYI